MASCLLLLGAESFDWFIVAPIATEFPAIVPSWSRIQRRLLLFAFPVALLSGIAWFVFVTMDMSDLPPSQALCLVCLRIVWNQTRFGSLWKLRLLLWTAAAVSESPRLLNFKPGSSAGSYPMRSMRFATTAFLVITLAWAGHGRDGPNLHIFADFLHLLFAAFWPTGLLPFGLLLLNLRKTPLPQKWLMLSALTRRFSAMSLICAASLIVTGVVNAWFLLGRLPNLFRTPYGQVLLVKLLIFTILLAIGAINLLYLKPRLLAGDNPEITSKRLQITVTLEWILASIILVIVGILGLLPPSR